MYLYDLLVKGGRLVDPGSGRNGAFDVAINGGTIVAVEADIPRARAMRVVEAAGLLVTAGFIDLHAHIADGITRHGINPDRAGVLQGVTTIVDGGSLGPYTFLGLRRHVLPASRTTIYGFLNLSFSGQSRMPELRSLDDLDEEMVETVLRTNRDVLRGIKVRCISPGVRTIGAAMLEIAHRHVDRIDGRVMVHIGDHGEGEGAVEVTREVVRGLRPGDILTHPYTSYPGGALDEDGGPLPEVREAAERGVVIDVGRGGRNFTFDNARRALGAGFLPTTISTDITLMTINGPVYGLADTASIFLNLGLTIDEVVERVTANAARALGLFDRIGSVELGKRADLTVIEHLVDGEHAFEGYAGERMTGTQLLVPRVTVANGLPIACELPSGSAMAAAAARR
jgi:dihydroorotase